MKRALLFLLLCSAMLYGAELRNGNLFLEISLQKATELSLNQSTELRITDASGLFSRTFTGPVRLSLSTASAVSFYGVTTDEPWTLEDEDSYIIRRSFAWRDSSLIIREEQLYLLRNDFQTREEAIAFADLNRLPRSRVIALPLSGASIQARDSRGNLHYFESPLSIQSRSPLNLDSSGLTYTGEFIVKVIGNDLQINHVISLENYLAGVIQNEIGSGAPPEAMKAQAVAARSHAVSLLLYNRHQNDGYDICNTTHCQVYKGEHLLNNNVLSAVLATSGEILSFDGRVIDATYHSACGGKTDASSNIWRGRPVPYLMGVTCIDECDSLDLSTESDARRWINTDSFSEGMSSWERRSQSWTRTISSSTFAANAGLRYINKIEIISRGHSGRILSLRLTGDTIKMLVGEYQIRRALGNLPSSLFYFEGRFSRSSEGYVSFSPSRNITVKGKGSGHGVGMCQVGALRMSREGITYDQILLHYYPGTSLMKEWLKELSYD